MPDEAKETKAKPERKPAPEVALMSADPSMRGEILAKLDEENPEFVHSYQRAEVDDWELMTKRQEVVEDGDGNRVHHMGDPVVRRPREYKEALDKAASDSARERVEAVDRPDKSTTYRSPKDQKDITDKKG